MVTCIRKQTIEDSFVFDMSIIIHQSSCSCLCILSLLRKKKMYSIFDFMFLNLFVWVGDSCIYYVILTSLGRCIFLVYVNIL